ncbi:MAG TPA: helix-turn-helix domain-containing protein [Candidatus Acidoferrum sp.]|nr:helix-turn-helix domain-containing protein [Candidatus Acidoferrum sp.]
MSGRFLLEEELFEIFGGTQRGDSIRGIARTIHRAPSTILRELRHDRLRYRQRTAPRFAFLQNEGIQTYMGGYSSEMYRLVAPSQGMVDAEFVAARRERPYRCIIR